MFICNTCLEDHFQNGESLSKSSNNCEICEEQAICNDIPSSRLIDKVQKTKECSVSYTAPKCVCGSDLLLTYAETVEKHFWIKDDGKRYTNFATESIGLQEVRRDLTCPICKFKYPHSYDTEGRIIISQAEGDKVTGRFGNQESAIYTLRNLHVKGEE